MQPSRALPLALAAALGVAGILALLAAVPGRPARAQSSKIPSACTAIVTESLRSPLRACETGVVTVTLGISCPPRLPLHMVFTVARHLLMEDHLDEVKAAAREAVNAVSFTPETQAGVISLSVQERVEQDMTPKQGSVAAAIGGIRLDNVDPTLNYYDWLGRAGRMLEEARSAAPAPPLEAVVLYSTGCPTGFESYCNRQAAAANQLKSQGVTVIGVCNPNARPFGFPLPNNHCRAIRDIASGGYYYDLARASQVGRALADLQALAGRVVPKKVILTEQLSGSLPLIPGSALPAPVVEGGKLSFNWDAVPPGSAVTATYRVQPGTPGSADLRLDTSHALVIDTLDRVSAPVPIPARSAEVVPCAAPSPTAPPSATPTPSPAASDTPRPTATETPPPPSATATASPAPSASPTGKPGLAYLPLLLNRYCSPSEKPNDVVLAIDASSSMLDPMGGATKLAAAQAAARRFVDLMRLEPGGDRAAVLAFNEAATLRAPLTDDRAALAAAIEGLSTALGTRIDRAIDRAEEALAAPPARAESQKVLILLTDGRPDGGSAQAALDAAARLRAGGAQVFVIGFGDAVDADYLRALAGRPERYLPAPDAAALRAIYESLAAELPCPQAVDPGPGP